MIKSRAKLKAMAHQTLSLKHDAVNPLVFDMSDPGCVSADTEFLTDRGWKRIDQYAPGDRVAQFYPDDKSIELVEPLQYVKKPCNVMVAIAPVRGTSQRLSPEHRVLYYRKDGSYDVCSAAEYMRDLHSQGAAHFDRKFCTTFSVRGKPGLLHLTDAEIRVMVAVIADGHFQTANSNRCVVRVKKLDKVLRLCELLETAGIEYALRACGGADPSFRVFTFIAPSHDKVFGEHWWGADQHDLEIIADELPYWDSAISSRPSGGVRFSSFEVASADFAQYAFAAAKRTASKALSIRDRTAEGRGVMIEYTVHAQNRAAMVGPGRETSVNTVSNPEGFKYCFEVPTSFLLLRHGGYIFATGNTGKTYVRIMGYAARRAKKAGCLLVLAPRSLLRAAWGNDIHKFAPHLKVTIATADKREAAFNEVADVYVANHDAVKWLAQQKPAFFKKFSDLVVDESPAFKHHTSQRSKAAGKIAKHFERRAMLTATPTSNGICDVWHQVHLLDGGRRLGPSFFGFRNSVCESKQVGKIAQAIKWTDKDGAEEAVYGLISDIVVRHKFEDCVDIPPTHTHTLPYEMTPKQQKIYNQMEQDQLLPILGSIANQVANALTNKQTYALAVNAAAVMTKLLQIGSGAVYDSSGGYTVVDTARYELLMDIAEARKHPLMFFYWQHQRDLLVAEAERRGMTYAVIDGKTSDNDRHAIVQKYQLGGYDVLFAHPLAAAHGLTLTKGTSTIWSGPTYNLEWFKQGGRRQARIGQTEKTEVITVLAENTRETEIYEGILMVKNARMSNLLNLFVLGMKEVEENLETV